MNPKSFCAFLFPLIVAVSGVSGAEVTNSIPSGIFLTDDGHLFLYKKGGRVVATGKILEAQQKPESLPSAQDLEGHWGTVTNGFQMSLRFQKSTFSLGETVRATVLIRNVSDQPRKYLRAFNTIRPSPINVVATKDMKPLKLLRADEVLDVGAVTQVEVFPNTQHKYEVELNRYYDLSFPGEYTFKAVHTTPDLGGSIEITSLPAKITIADSSNR